MTPIDTSDRLAELESITREYSRYSRSAGGLSALAGGLLALASFALGAFAKPSPAISATLIAIPLLWVVGKQIASSYYQRSGRVEESVATDRARIQWWLSVGITGLVVVVLLGLLASAGSEARDLPRPVLVAYVALLVAIPAVAWRWLRTPVDLVIGTFLLCQAALVVTGKGHGLASPAIIFVPLALLMVGKGWRDHRRFRQLEARMAEFGGSAGTSS